MVVRESEAMKVSECSILEGSGRKVVGISLWNRDLKEGFNCGCDNWLRATKPHSTALRCARVVFEHFCEVVWEQLQ